jgi:hypothetical protein
VRTETCVTGPAAPLPSRLRCNQQAIQRENQDTRFPQCAVFAVYDSAVLCANDVAGAVVDRLSVVCDYAFSKGKDVWSAGCADWMNRGAGRGVKQYVNMTRDGLVNAREFTVVEVGSAQCPTFAGLLPPARSVRFVGLEWCQFAVNTTYATAADCADETGNATSVAAVALHSCSGGAVLDCDALPQGQSLATPAPRHWVGEQVWLNRCPADRAPLAWNATAAHQVSPGVCLAPGVVGQFMAKVTCDAPTVLPGETRLTQPPFSSLRQLLGGPAGAYCATVAFRASAADCRTGGGAAANETLVCGSCDFRLGRYSKVVCDVKLGTVKHFTNCDPDCNDESCEVHVVSLTHKMCDKPVGAGRYVTAAALDMCTSVHVRQWLPNASSADGCSGKLAASYRIASGRCAPDDNVALRCIDELGAPTAPADPTAAPAAVDHTALHVMIAFFVLAFLAALGFALYTVFLKKRISSQHQDYLAMYDVHPGAGPSEELEDIDPDEEVTTHTAPAVNADV